MEKQKDKMWFSHHSKSSAAVVSIGVHALLVVIALSFVAVTVIKKDDKKFEAKQVTRPKMPIKRLQVPVNIKKKKQPKPKLRKRIVVKPNINKNMPDIKMPEISGLKGGLGAAGGLEGGGGLGFSLPEIQVFGIRSKGEKVFIALDSDKMMLEDKVGGILAYQIIKNEVTKIIEGLSPTTLFNLAVFQHSDALMLFPKMVPASSANVSKVKKWLAPLNEFVEGREGAAYGVGTLGAGGIPIRGDFLRGKIAGMDYSPPRGNHWYAPIAMAMQQQADTVFVLTGWWGLQRTAKGEWPEWSESASKRWDEKVVEALAIQENENKKRAARGEPPQVTRDHHQLIRTIFSLEELIAWRRPEPEWYLYSGREMAESIHLIRQEYASKSAEKIGLKKKKKDDFSLNVVYFVGKGIEPGDREGRFNAMVRRCKGQYRRIDGLEAVKMSVSGN